MRSSLPWIAVPPDPCSIRSPIRSSDASDSRRGFGLVEPRIRLLQFPTTPPHHQTKWGSGWELSGRDSGTTTGRCREDNGERIEQGSGARRGRKADENENNNNGEKQR